MLKEEIEMALVPDSKLMEKSMSLSESTPGRSVGKTSEIS